MISEPLSYRDLDTSLTGVLCRDESRRDESRTSPGILLIHGGAGLDEHARQQARRYAALGYTVLACHEAADRRSFAAARDLLAEALTPGALTPEAFSEAGR